jgi:hypothetical protein
LTGDEDEDDESKVLDRSIFLEPALSEKSVLTGE